MIISLLNKIITPGLFLLLSFSDIFSQPANRQYFDSALASTHQSFQAKRGVFYVINGLPYDNLQIDTALKKYDLKYLVDLQFLSCEKAGFPHCYSDVAIILFAYNQKGRNKRNAWREAQQLIANKPNVTMLFIDNSLVDPAVAKGTFKTLRLKDIMYLDITNKGNNRQIRIWKFTW